MIYGLIAALGWGVGDFTAAVAGRRLGSLLVVLFAQGASAIVVAVIFLATGGSLAPLAGVLAILALNAMFSATAYVTHYRALELGPVAVVSPVGATYALVGVILSTVLLGEHPSPVTIVGGLVTVVGVMLASTDLAKLRAGTHGMPPGLPWAVCSAIGFGVGAFTLARLSRAVGWELALTSSRFAQFVAFAVVGLLWRDRLRVRELEARPVLFAAIVVGGADLLGVIAFSVGAERGFVTPVLIASAVFPLIAVTLSVLFLHERPVPNQYAGVVLAIAGLTAVGLGAVGSGT